MPGRIDRPGGLRRRVIGAVMTGIVLAGLPGIAAAADPDPVAERAAHMRDIVQKMRASDPDHPDGSTHQHGGMAALSADDLRFLGLRHGTGVCTGMYEIVDRTVDHSCTHGFDPMEPVAPGSKPKPADPSAALTPETIALAATCDPIYDPESCPTPAGWKVPTQIPCYSSGPYVEVLYVYSGTSRIAAFKERIRRSIAWADLMYKVSAAAVKNPSGTAGNRHVHWAMAAGCKLKVTVAQVPASALGDLGATKDSLMAQGKIASTTKYIAYIDTGDGCDGGIAELHRDTTPGSTNDNNDGGSFGMLDAGCTGSSDFGSIIASHELTHTLGAVQSDAPHATPAGHCWDDSGIPGYGADIMCYDDFSVLTSKFYIRCPITVPETFDCGKDDYFNPYPKSGNYLYNHWNTASNRFLSTGEPPAWDTIPVLSVALVGNGTKIGGTATISAIVTAPTGLTVDHVRFRMAGQDVGSDNDAPYDFELDTFPIPNLANVKIEAIAYDQYGMPSPTGTATYTVANPQVHLDAPAAHLISSPKATWAATATASGGRTVSKVEFLVFGAVAATDTIKPYGGTVNLGALTGYTDGIGFVDVAARVTDSAGVVRTIASRSMWISAATATLAPLHTSAVKTGVPTSLRATITPATGVGIAKVDFLVNETPVGTDTTAPYAVNWTPGPTATKNLRVVVTDTAGYAWKSPPEPFEVLSTDATVTIDAPADGSLVDGDLLVDGSATAPAGGTVDWIQANVDGIWFETVPLEGGFATIPLGGTGPGDRFVRVTAGGGSPSGGWALGSATRTIRVDGPDIALTGPVSGASVRQSVTLGATVGDLDGAIVSGVEFYQGEELIGWDDTAPYEVSWDTLSEPDGLARITARVWTDYGSYLSPVRTLTKRNLRAWFTSPLPNATVSGIVLFKAGGKCDIDCVLENATLRIDGVPVKYDNSVPYSFTWDSTAVADGPHTYSVGFSTSDARAAATIPFPFNVDNTP